MFYVLLTLHSKRFQSSYCAKVKTKKKTPLLSFLFFALVSTFLTNSRGNACYAGYKIRRTSTQKLKQTWALSFDIFPPNLINFLLKLIAQKV